MRKWEQCPTFRCGKWEESERAVPLAFGTPSHAPTCPASQRPLAEGGPYQVAVRELSMVIHGVFLTSWTVPLNNEPEYTCSQVSFDRVFGYSMRKGTHPFICAFTLSGLLYAVQFEGEGHVLAI